MGGHPGTVSRLRSAATVVFGACAAAVSGVAAPAPGASAAPATPAAPAGSAAAGSAARKNDSPVEYTLSLQQDDWRVRATLRPGEPVPGKLVEILFDIGRQTSTDAVPLADGKLALTITGPGTRTRLLVRPLGDAGIYGLHWTPGARGLWTLALGPWAGDGPAISFQVGAGVPMPASSQGHAVQASRVVVAAGRAADPLGSTEKQRMAELGQRWLRAQELGADAAGEAVAMAVLARASQGRVPKEWSKDAREYDLLATDLASALDKAAALQDREKVAQALQPLGQSSCLRCHVKFRDGFVADLRSWPEVKPWKR